ncbi:dihydrolipoamide acetyltransferase family protein [Spiroplasma chrysopicola]|uniref:Dihydrolipoamide acetyltransferase component of pyruvate dehydrogenase complex n=1 Tax=Spiroplasma chrysopicola DF-1 TaxID=1276227 RepID=R4U0R1_9MOLU|nr:dihydrolipoamide acetyltransferase family protein [Spiroplasma chrysopicola]AGM24862.1 pyruvate dehydrogenase E2 component (dihydrolipoamide acetyltransferase) [Spiroplasma chrysopicola DF-1]
MVKFKFADIGEGLTEGKVGAINIKVGDKVKDGDEMFSVETDKVNAEIYSPCDGVITKINMKVGDVIYVGDVVVEIDDGKGDAPVASATPAPSVAEPVEEEKAAGVVGAVPISNAVLPSRGLPTTNNAAVNNEHILATPIVRKMAADMKVDLSKIKGTGPNGRIMKADLLAGPTSAPIASGPSIGGAPITIPNIQVSGNVKREPMSSIRKAIAKQMTLAKTVIAETTLIKNVNVTKLIEIRTQLKGQAEKQGVKLTYMPFFMKACAIALKEFPILNSSYDQQSEEIIYKEYYNIGMATDTANGLMVPVVKGVDQLNVLQIGAVINDLATRTRDRKLKADEMRDGTFTISNFGSAGVEIATPVINFPEVAILGVGTIEKKPVVNANNEIEISSILPLSLTIDHRLIDGADGGRFLQRVSALLESPALLLL